MEREEIKCKTCKLANRSKCSHELMKGIDITAFRKEDNHYTAPDNCPRLRELWKVDSINLKFERFGEMKDKYSGSISFRNGLNESFSFHIYPGMAEKYIELIAEELVKGATNLGNKLLMSLGLNEREDK